jgi:homoserine kinase
VEPFTVTVPGSTSNLGPGFDALGLALDLQLRVRVRPTDAADIELSVSGEGADVLGSLESNRIVSVMVDRLTRKGLEAGGVSLEIENEIPVERGLGGSAAATVAGLLIADAIACATSTRQELLDVAAALEGHADNSAPSLWGGFVCASFDDGKVCCVATPIKCDGLRVALCVPERPLRTQAARELLPGSVPFADAVFNVGRTALMIAALATGEWDALARATEDRLHQEYRMSLMPELRLIRQSAQGAGALGVFLSGAGSTVAAFCTAETSEDVANEMVHAARTRDLAARGRVCSIHPDGARLDRAESRRD